MMRSIPLPVLALALLGACAAPSASTRLERMYVELRAEVGGRRLDESAAGEWSVHQKQRVESVRAYIDEDALKSADDYFYASVILVETDDEENLVHSLGLALHSAKLGLDRGFRVAAEATDKICVKKGNPQRYGTQFVYEPVLKAWRLYPYDPNTTDVERHAMGVEPLAKLREREAALNDSTGGRPR